MGAGRRRAGRPALAQPLRAGPFGRHRAVAVRGRLRAGVVAARRRPRRCAPGAAGLARARRGPVGRRRQPGPATGGGDAGGRPGSRGGCVRADTGRRARRPGGRRPGRADRRRRAECGRRAGAVHRPQRGVRALAQHRGPRPRFRQPAPAESLRVAVLAGHRGGDLGPAAAAPLGAPCAAAAAGRGERHQPVAHAPAAGGAAGGAGPGLAGRARASPRLVWGGDRLCRGRLLPVAGPAGDRHRRGCAARLDAPVQRGGLQRPAGPVAQRAGADRPAASGRLGLGRAGLRALHAPVCRPALLRHPGQRAQPATAPGGGTGRACGAGAGAGGPGLGVAPCTLARGGSAAPAGLGLARSARAAQHGGVPALVRAVPDHGRPGAGLAGIADWRSGRERGAGPAE